MKGKEGEVPSYRLACVLDQVPGMEVGKMLHQADQCIDDRGVVRPFCMSTHESLFCYLPVGSYTLLRVLVRIRFVQLLSRIFQTAA